MGLTDEERERLADVVRLQPTKNAELGAEWGLDDGSAVHGYLESHLSDYYYRDDDSLIRATDEAADLVDIEPGIEPGTDGGPGSDAGGGNGGVPDVIRVPEPQARIVGVLAGPDERSQSVVSVLHDLRDAYDIDPEPEAVRKALRALSRAGAVEVVQRTVPTFRLAAARDRFRVEVAE